MIENLRITAGSAVIQISISIGIAGRETEMSDADALVNAADRALYQAKQSGRNHSCIFVQGQLRTGPR